MGERVRERYGPLRHMNRLEGPPTWHHSFLGFNTVAVAWQVDETHVQLIISRPKSCSLARESCATSRAKLCALCSARYVMRCSAPSSANAPPKNYSKWTSPAVSLSRQEQTIGLAPSKLRPSLYQTGAQHAAQHATARDPLHMDWSA